MIVRLKDPNAFNSSPVKGSFNSMIVRLKEVLLTVGLILEL